MDSLITQILIILALIVVNGFFSMAEIAVISSRKARLQQRAEEGDPGAKIALELASSPSRFLSTIQIGITLVGILAGAFGGAIMAEQLAPSLNRLPWIAPHGSAVSLFIVVLAITYLSLIIGELVPKPTALNHTERIAAAVAPFLRALSWLGAPLVHLLSLSTQVVLRLFGIQPSAETSVTEEEIKLRVLGMHTANPISGDFSLGVDGLLIQNGATTAPVKGMALAGNIMSLYSDIVCIGNDLRFYGTVGSPSILVAEMDISGN